MDREAWLDTCWLDQYRGLSVDHAMALAKSQERMFRVIRPDSIVTADLSNQRLNIVVDGDGSLIGFEAD